MPRWGDEVITIDRSDTLQSFLAKLESTAATMPVVVLSPDCRVADSPLTYRLMVRVSERFAIPLAVVTGNPAWRQLAREHGLRCFSSLGALRRARRGSALSSTEEWADALLSTLHPSSFKQVWPVAGTLILALSAVTFFVVPVMKVTLQAPAEMVTRNVTVKVDVGTARVDADSATIPGRIIEHRFTVADFIDTTGNKNVGKDPAKGEVTVLNNSTFPVTIPSGTALSSASGVKFTTTAATTVGPFVPSGSPQPAGAPAAGVGVGVKIPVVAAEPGEKGNVPALAISRIEGDAFRGLTVVNEQPLTGGTEAKVRSVSAEDRAKLKEALFQKAQTQSLSELTVRVGQSESLIPNSMQVQIDGEDYDKAQDEEGDKLKGTVYVVASGMAFANQDLNGVVESDWKKSTPKDYRALPGNLALAAPEVVDAGPRTAKLTVRVTGRAEPVVEVGRLSELLRGASLSDARTKLASLQGGFRLEQVEIWPVWAPRAYRIEVQTVQ